MATPQPNEVKGSPQAFRIASKDAFALTFALAGQQEFTEYETLLCRVPPVTVRTWLPLTEAVRQREIDKDVVVFYTSNMRREKF